MKNKFKNSISFIIVFMMLFSNIIGICSDRDIVKAEENNKYIKVRVEGFNKTLFNDKVKWDSSMKNPLEVLKATVGEENIEGDNRPTYFITGILGEKQGENDGWCYYVKFNSGNIVMPSVGVEEFNGMTDASNQLISDELVFYKCSYSGANLITKIPIVNIENDGCNFKVKIKNNEVGNNPIKDVEVKIEGESTYKTNANGEVSFKLNKAGKYNLQILKESNGYPEIVRQCVQIESEGGNSNKLQAVVEELKNKYKDKTDLKADTVMAYNSLMTDKSQYKKSFKLNESENAAAYAENIIGCLATGQDASQYADKLVKLQNEEGKFILDEDDAESVTALADSILALDMVRAKYNLEKAVDSLVAMSNSGHYEDVSTTAYVVRALVKHKDMDNVKSLMDSCIDYMQKEQLENGGFDYYEMGNSPYSTAPVVQALIRAGEDLNKDTWNKNGRSIVDSLLACKVEDKGFEMAEGVGYGYDDPTATEFAFNAISDVYNGICAYDKFTNKEKPQGPTYEEKIQNAIDGLRDYLTSMENRMDSNYKQHPAFYRSLETLALNCSSDNIKNDVEDLSGKFNINEAEGTLPYVMNIIGLKSSGRSTEKYVDLLKNSQQEDGSFKAGIVEQSEWAVIALDMAEAEYNVEKAAQYIVNKNQDVEDISLLAVAVTALAKHKDILGVEEFITSKLNYINSKQLQTGGFEMQDMMTKENTESSIPASYVISALVANGINPLTDEKWIKDGNTLLDSLLKFKKLNYFLCNNGEYAEYFYKDEATEQAFIALCDLKYKKSSYNSVKNAISYKSKIKNALDKIRNYITTTEKRQNGSLEEVDAYYSWQEALAINYTSENIKNDYSDIRKKVKLNKKEDVLSLSEDIMSIIAAGYKVDNYEGKNYVQALINFQNANGQFIEKNGKANVYKQAYSIIALDMVSAEYKSSKSIEALIEMASGGHFDNVEETAWAIIALSKHKDVTGVSNLVDSSIEYLKQQQSADGGFDMAGCGDTPQYTAVVIQGLIANGINPLSTDWVKQNGNLVDSMLNDQMEDGTFRACLMMGDYIDIPSTERAFAALADLYKCESMYKEVEPIVDDSNIVKKFIKEIKSYYKEDNKYNYIQAMALNILGEDVSKINSKLELRQAEADRTHIVLDNSTAMHSKDIMAIIASGNNPRNYNNRDYVKELEDAQKENGTFNIEGEDINILSDQANSIISLDMADGNYNVEKAVSKLIEAYSSKKKPSIFNTSETIIALSRHKDIQGVEEKINSCIKDLKEMQIETGGFDYNKGSSWDDPHEVSEYDAAAIQAIIAAGKNPTDEEFKNNGKTVIDALSAFKNDNHFVYDSTKVSYDEYNDEATGMMLAALISLDKNKSIYEMLSIKNDKLEDEFKITMITEGDLHLGEDAKVQINAENKSSKEKPCVLIVALYDKNTGKMIKYSYVTKTVKPNEIENMTSGFTIPNEGNYEVKAMVWDSMNIMKPLSKVILFKVN